jgi:hypothetical protein
MNAIIMQPGSRATCESVDDLPPAYRALVHEFGYSVVRAFHDSGVREPEKIRHLIRSVWLGAREPGNVQGKSIYSQPTHRTMDMLLSQGRITGMAGLISNLRSQSAVIVSVTPTDAMVRASIEATGRMGLVSKAEKHRGRLLAAIEVGAFRMPTYPDANHPLTGKGDPPHA